MTKSDRRSEVADPQFLQLANQIDDDAELSRRPLDPTSTGSQLGQDAGLFLPRRSHVRL